MRVYLDSDWTPYALEVAGLDMLGVVRSESGDVGALAQTHAGVYVQVIGALIRDLDQDRVKVEIAIARRRSGSSATVLPFEKKRPYG